MFCMSKNLNETTLGTKIKTECEKPIEIFRKTPEARKKIDELIDVVIERVEARDAWLEQDRADKAEYERKLAAWKARQAAKSPSGSESQITKDYASMSQEELKREYRKADEEGDFDKMMEISDYIK